MPAGCTLADELSLLRRSIVCHAVPYRTKAPRVRTWLPAGQRRSVGPVGAARAGAHRLLQVLADHQVGVRDAPERAADCLAGRHAGPFGVTSEGPGAAGQPRGAGQLGGKPAALRLRAYGLLLGTVRHQPSDFRVEPGEAVAVLGDGLPVQHRLAGPRVG